MKRKIALIGTSNLFMNLLKQDLLNAMPYEELSIEKFEFQEVPQTFEEPIDFSFIFYEESKTPLLIAEKLRSQSPNCYIIFVHSSPDTTLYADFKKRKIAQVSLSVTAEKVNKLFRDALQPSLFNQNAEAIDALVYEKLKRYIRPI